MTAAEPVALFYSYAHEDEKHREDLEGHLKILERRGLLQPWHDRSIVPSGDWDKEIDEHLKSAELVLLLISKDFINSSYIWGKELNVAKERHERGGARVVPIFLRAVDIEPEDAWFMKLQGLPTDLRPVTSWPNVDEAWTNVAKGLRATIGDIRAHRAAKPQATRTGGEAPSAPSHAPLPPVRSPQATARGSLRSAYERLRKVLSSVLERGEVVPGPGGRVEGPITPQPAARDAGLDSVAEAIVQAIERANAARHGPPLDMAAIREQVLRLIDTPEQKRVLWVDDHPENNLNEAAVLAKLQIEVVAVRSSDEAWQRIDSDPEPFDLVLSDWERRSEGAGAGLKLLRQLRAAGKTMPFVFYHGVFAADQRASRAREALAASALGEAVLPGELLALVLKAAGGAQPLGGVTPITAVETAELLRESKSIIIVPGYGMAAAQAQHTAYEITRLLRDKGVNVRFGIHPVAGRLPGHVNALLAEAKVPCGIVLDLDEINKEFPNTDVAMAIGANDIVNPSAQDDPTNPIAGMPVLEVWKAKTSIVLKRSLASGYAGVDNPLFFRGNNRMLFGDAKEMLDEVLVALKG